MSAIAKLVRNPARYVPLIGKVALQRLSHVFQNKSFFLQGQMDIHPLARWPAHCLEETGGFSPRNEDRQVCSLEPWDNTRRDMLALLLRVIITQHVPGAFAELGVYQGLTARLIHRYAPEREFYLFDTFAGFTAQSDTRGERGAETAMFSDTSMEVVRRFISPNENVHIVQGFFPQSIPADARTRSFAFVHLDADLYAPTMEGLQFFYPRVSPRGIIVVHDYNSWSGARKAVDEFFTGKPELPLPMPDKSGSAVIVKISEAAAVRGR